MISDKDSIKALNELLQGEYMAIESFNNFVSKIDDSKTIKVFQDIQHQHRSNIDKLAKYIQDICGQPKENLGMKGKMADIMLDIELSPKDNKDIIKKAIEGETRGVNAAEKVLRGQLDEKSRDIAGEILEKDRESIHILENLIKL